MVWSAQWIEGRRDFGLEIADIINLVLLFHFIKRARATALESMYVLRAEISSAYTKVRSSSKNSTLDN